MTRRDLLRILQGNKRPWVTPAVLREAETNPYAEYDAWESWMFRNLDNELPDEESHILDTLSLTQKAYLFNLMGRLADGEFPCSAS